MLFDHSQRECNKQLEWYKGVKQNQGSVEVTSFGQMNNIFALGYYKIGSTEPGQALHTINELVSLKLDVREKEVLKSCYTLDELRDLESKLVLITGSKAENRKDVDQYLNVSLPCHVVHYTQILIHLNLVQGCRH